MLLRCQMLEGASRHDAGRRLLAQMYREMTGREMPEILIADRGKPYFKDGSAHFSISHTKRRVFCVISDKPVGIDAEEIDRDIDLQLAAKILSENEKRRYEAALDKRQTLLRFWVLKEALAKASGEGLRGYPNKTDCDPFDPRIIETDGCFVAVVQEDKDVI